MKERTLHPTRWGGWKARGRNGFVSASLTGRLRQPPTRFTCPLPASVFPLLCCQFALLTTTSVCCIAMGPPSPTRYASSRDFSHPPDVIAYPRDEQDVLALLDWCSDVGAAIIPFG